MKSLHEKIVSADYRKIAKRFVVIAVLFAVVGGITGALLLRTQISDMMTVAENHQQLTEGQKTDKTYTAQKDKASHRSQNDDKQITSEKKDHESEHDWEDVIKSQITPVPKGTMALLGIIGFCVMVLAAVYWLLIAAWLYKAAFRAKMHRMIWLFAGLIGNLAAVVVFLVLRNIFIVHCSQCGEWCRKGRFCTECGSEFSVTCPACGAQQPADQKFCGRCGAGIPEKNDSKSDEDTGENSENAD